jgi:hypothetical protein
LPTDEQIMRYVKPGMLSRLLQDLVIPRVDKNAEDLLFEFSGGKLNNNTRRHDVGAQNETHMPYSSNHITHLPQHFPDPMERDIDDEVSL